MMTFGLVLLVGLLGPTIGAAAPAAPAAPAGSVDPRAGLTRGGPALGLTVAEIKRLRGAVGRIVCDVAGTADAFDATAVAIGADDVIVTTAHSLYDDEKQTYVDPGECTFTTLSDPPIQRRLRPGADGTAFGTQRPLADIDLDWAVLKLDRSLPEGHAFAFDPGAVALHPGAKLVTLSAQQERMVARVGPFEPIVQACAWWSIRERLPNLNSSFVTGCIGTRGASGSPTFTFEREAVPGRDRLRVIGILRGFFGRRYDPRRNASTEGAYARHLLFDGPLAEAIVRLAALRLPPPGPPTPIPPVRPRF